MKNQKFEKQIIKIEINVPVGFSIIKSESKQYCLSNSNIAANYTGFIQGITKHVADRIIIELIFAKEDPK